MKMTMTPSYYMIDSKLQEEAGPTQTTLSRQSSSLSYECHSNLIFEEMFSGPDVDDGDDDDDDFSLDGGAKHDIFESSERCAAAAAVDDHEVKHCRDNDDKDSITGETCTAASLDAILNDETTPFTSRYEARAIDRAMRRGNSMLLRRCSSEMFTSTSTSTAVVRRTPSFVDRVIRSVSAELRASGHLRDNNDNNNNDVGASLYPLAEVKKNATFSPMMDDEGGLTAGRRMKTERQIDAISKIGRSLLASSSSGDNNKRARGERKEARRRSSHSSTASTSGGGGAKLTMDSLGSLDSTDFLKMMKE